MFSLLHMESDVLSISKAKIRKKMYPYIYLYIPLHTTYQLYILGGGGRVGLGYILFVAKCFCALIRLTFEAKKKREGLNL